MALHLVRILCFASLAATLILQGCAKPPPASDRGNSLPKSARVAEVSVPARPNARSGRTALSNSATASAPGEQLQGEEIPPWLDELFHSPDPNVRIPSARRLGATTDRIAGPSDLCARRSTRVGSSASAGNIGARTSATLSAKRIGAKRKPRSRF